MLHRFYIGLISFKIEMFSGGNTTAIAEWSINDDLIQGWKLNSQQAETFKGDTTSLKTVKTSLYYFHNIQICHSATIYIKQHRCKFSD